MTGARQAHSDPDESPLTGRRLRSCSSGPRWTWLLAIALTQALLTAPSEAASRVRPLTEEARLDPEGEPAESFYAANSALITDESGRLLCLWGAPRRDFSGELGIRAQAFSRTLAPLASEFLVDDEPHEPDSLAIVPPSATVTRGGTKVVAWSRQTSSVLEDDGNVWARLFSGLDLPHGPEFQINSESLDWQFDPRIAGGSGSRWIAGWQNQAFDPSDYSARIQLFDAETSLGLEQSTRTESHPLTQHIDVAADQAGEFYAVWSADASAGRSSSSEVPCTRINRSRLRRCRMKQASISFHRFRPCPMDLFWSCGVGNSQMDLPVSCPAYSILRSRPSFLQPRSGTM